jgi:hypothetical protein
MTIANRRSGVTNMNKTHTFLTAAGFLFLSLGCGSSEPNEADASITPDAQLGSDGATAASGGCQQVARSQRRVSFASIPSLCWGSPFDLPSIPL